MKRPEATASTQQDTAGSATGAAGPGLRNQRGRYRLAARPWPQADQYEDYKTYPQRIHDTHQNELSFFVKDDWKVLRSLTLNLGVRWDYYGVPYDGFGLMPLTVGGHSRIFGISGNSFADWMRPGVRAEPTHRIRRQEFTES
jgi:outer membrane receptor protein involved in Fe transport